MNATNYDLIAAALSEADTDKWAGRYPSETTFGGKTMACVRVRRYRNKPSAPAPQTPAAPTPQPDDEFAQDFDLQIQGDDIKWSVA